MCGDGNIPPRLEGSNYQSSQSSDALPPICSLFVEMGAWLVELANSFVLKKKIQWKGGGKEGSLLNPHSVLSVLSSLISLGPVDDDGTSSDSP